MTYQPYLIANFSTGLDKELDPWILPDDAYFELNDGYVWNGATYKREGYSGFANGENSTYCESRMVQNVATSYTVTGDINSSNDTYTINLTTPVVAGSLIITGSNPAQTVNDDGVGNLTGDGTGTIVYGTGVVSLVFNSPPVTGSTITVEYGNYSVGDGTATYAETLANTPIRRGTVTITASGQSVTDNGKGAFTGDGSGSINYTTGVVSVTFSSTVSSGTPITVDYDFHPGNPVMGIMSFYPSDNARELIVADTQNVNKYDQTTDTLIDITNNQFSGTYKNFVSWVNYEDASSNPRLLFCNGDLGDVIQQYDGTSVTDYSPTLPARISSSINAVQMFEFKDRLLLFQTIEDGTLFPRRIMVSGTGSDSDNFSSSATGAGTIDIPDDTWYFGAAFNRDDILFFTESSVWSLKYTGNDVKPFILQRIDSSRGSKAAFSVISYLNRTFAASPRGLILSDGYKVERMDQSIPNFTVNEVNANAFDSCFSGFFDEERDVYFLYPSIDANRPELLEEYSSDKILVSNFEEDNFSIYKIPLSCIGNYQIAFTKIWSGLTEENGYPNWDAMAAEYGSWQTFSLNKGSPLSIGGGHKGEIWKMTVSESQDNPQKIRNITAVDTQSVQVTTDWNNYKKGDFITFEDVEGMTEVNNKQGQITSIDTDYTVFTVDFGQNFGTFASYTGGGQASRCIPFETVSKKFNPWVNQDKKVRCGWMYFYVDAVETSLLDEDGNPVPAFIDIDLLVNNNEGVNFSNTKFKYRINCTNESDVKGGKKWVKIWINQVGQFLQYRLSNNQAGARIKIDAIMPGFQPVGRLL